MDDIKRIERLAKKNREKSLGEQTSKALDKSPKVRYVDRSMASTDSDRIQDMSASRLFNEFKKKPFSD